MKSVNAEYSIILESKQEVIIGQKNYSSQHEDLVGINHKMGIIIKWVINHKMGFKSWVINHKMGFHVQSKRCKKLKHFHIRRKYKTK